MRHLKEIGEFVVMVACIHVLVVCIGIFGLVYCVALACFAVSEAGKWAIGHRRLWQCAWCKCYFKVGGIKVAHPDIGKMQGHGMCAECAKRELSEMENAR